MKNWYGAQFNTTDEGLWVYSKHHKAHTVWILQYIRGGKFYEGHWSIKLPFSLQHFSPWIQQSGPQQRYGLSQHSPLSICISHALNEIQSLTVNQKGVWNIPPLHLSPPVSGQLASLSKRYFGDVAGENPDSIPIARIVGIVVNMLRSIVRGNISFCWKLCGFLSEFRRAKGGIIYHYITC